MSTPGPRSCYTCHLLYGVEGSSRCGDLVSLQVCHKAGVPHCCGLRLVGLSAGVSLSERALLFVLLQLCLLSCVSFGGRRMAGVNYGRCVLWHVFHMADVPYDRYILWQMFPTAGVPHSW